MSQYPKGYDTSAHNHLTVVPEESDDFIEYDANSAHDQYMAARRSSCIRSGTVEPCLGRIIRED